MRVRKYRNVVDQVLIRAGVFATNAIRDPGEAGGRADEQHRKGCPGERGLVAGITGRVYPVILVRIEGIGVSRFHSR